MKKIKREKGKRKERKEKDTCYMYAKMWSQYNEMKYWIVNMGLGNFLVKSYEKRPFILEEWWANGLRFEIWENLLIGRRQSFSMKGIKFIGICIGKIWCSVRYHMPNFKIL